MEDSYFKFVMKKDDQGGYAVGLDIKGKQELAVGLADMIVRSEQVRDLIMTSLTMVIERGAREITKSTGVIEPLTGGAEDEQTTEA